MSKNIIVDNHTLHILENNGVVDFGTRNNKEKRSLICSFKVKNKEKFTDCYPNNIFHRCNYCDDCPDFWKNYNIIVYDSIRSAELDINSNIHLIRADIEHDGGKYVRMYSGEEPVLLLGATTTIEDYYWLYMDKDKNIKMSSCVGGYEVITDTEELRCMSIVEYLRHNEREDMLSNINDYIDAHKYDKMITKIYL